MSKKGEISLDHYLSISRAMAGQLDFQTALQLIADQVRQMLPHDHMDIAIISPDKTGQHFAIEVGIETGWGEDGFLQPTNLSPIRDVLEDKVSHILTGDAWVDPQFHFTGAFDKPIFDANLHSRIHVPMIVHGVVHGVLNISRHKRHAYTKADLRVAHNIADLISPYFYALNMGEQARKSAIAEGSALGRERALRSGALRLTEAMEDQRKRLGMELHDQTLGDLSNIYRRVSQMALHSKNNTVELINIGESIARCTAELRRIIENTKPGVLELFGFQQAIEAQLERAVAGIKPPIFTSVEDLTGSVLDHAADSLCTSIFRIVQEAVTNAVKYSHCRNINVLIERQNDCVIIKVRNDGNPPKTDWDKSSRGVDNMKVRAALISAEIRFDRDEIENETLVILEIPHYVLNAKASHMFLEDNAEENTSLKAFAGNIK